MLPSHDEGAYGNGLRTINILIGKLRDADQSVCVDSLKPSRLFVTVTIQHIVTNFITNSAAFKFNELVSRMATFYTK